MKAAVCYYSSHHGNTQKILEAMAEGNDLTLIDVTARTAVHLEEYDLIGFASGIYHGKFHDTVPAFIRQYLPDGKDVFFCYTCGVKREGYTRTAVEAAVSKNAQILGEFGCMGFDTYGPFRLIGGIAKGHPNAAELQSAKEFYASLSKK